MRKTAEKGRCKSCGDYTEVYEYNKNKTCRVCLGLNSRGVFSEEIFKRNIGKREKPTRRKL